MQVRTYKSDTKADRIASIISECKHQGLVYNAQIAYVLATVQHETAQTFSPVVEAYWLSEDWRKKNLRYYPFHGRGYVQITWESNYKKYSDLLGQDFVNNPDKVLDPNISNFILVDGFLHGRFTGKKLSDYIGGSKVDYVNARRCINGTDRAGDIAAIAKDYYRQLEEGILAPLEEGSTEKVYYVSLKPEIETSYLKVSTGQSSDLSDEAKLEFNSSIVFVAKSYKKESGHLKIKLVEPVKDVEDWYVFEKHVNLEEQSVDAAPVAPETAPPAHTSAVIPWFSQRDNKIRPSQTCNMTSAAMVIEGLFPGKYSGSGQLEDRLTQECVRDFGKDGIYYHANIVKMLARYGIKSTFSTTTPFSKINAHLDQGLPVIYSGKFTRSGHIIVIVDRDETGYIVNDPWGEWFPNGYQAISGERKHYSYNLMKRVSYGGSSQGWAHLCQKA